MSIDTATNAMNELHAVIDRIRNGVEDPNAAKQALARLSREREELRKKIGTVDVAVELIRDARDQ